MLTIDNLKCHANLLGVNELIPDMSYTSSTWWCRAISSCSPSIQSCPIIIICCVARYHEFFWKYKITTKFWERGSYFVNYANPIYGIATICHQVRWSHWGHPSLFHTTTSLLIWKKNVLHERYIMQTYLNEIYKHAFRVCTIWYAQAFQLMNYCGFNIQPFCCDVCEDHRRPQTLAEMCRNMGICCGFRSMTAKVKYLGFM